MKNVAILGAGISGLSIGKMLKKSLDVKIFEKGEHYGGIAKTKTVDEAAYHMIGGHCFNSKHQDVLDFVFNEVLAKENWHSIQRRANILFEGMDISYPIEFAVKEIHESNPDLAINITSDFLSTNDDKLYDNLEEWFRKKFGNTLAEKYFIPYNAKIWGKHPSKMSSSWVEGKLPIPNKESFFKGLISEQKDLMPHASFYYPNSNNQNTFIDKLAENLQIVTDYEVNKVAFNRDTKKWIINDDQEFDIVISTLPLNIIPLIITNTPSNILESASKLKYNKVTTMLWETVGTDKTWTYVPSEEDLFHRYIHIGNFYSPQKNYSITESVGEKSYDEMHENGLKNPFLIKPLAYNVSNHAYVVFDENYKNATNDVKEYIQNIGLHTLGRFGEWEYYNMDICIKSALDLSIKILNE